MYVACVKSYASLLALCCVACVRVETGLNSSVVNAFKAHSFYQIASYYCGVIFFIELTCTAFILTFY